MIDLNDVSLFVRVVEAGSFSAAARSLGLPKTSVSRRVARLEAGLGARLFHRSTRKLVLTADGQAYHEQVAPALAEVFGAGNAILSDQTVPSGRLRVSAPVSLGDDRLIGRVIHFLRSYESLSIELVLSDTRPDLIAERVDLALVVAAERPDPKLPARKLATVRKLAVASPAYLRSRGLPTKPDDLKAHECILFRGSLDDDNWQFEGPEGPHAVSVPARLATTSAASVLRAVEAGLGIALLPEILVTARLASGELQRVLPDHVAETASLYAILPSRRHVPAGVARLLEELHSIASP